MQMLYACKDLTQEMVVLPSANRIKTAANHNMETLTQPMKSS